MSKYIIINRRSLSSREESETFGHDTITDAREEIIRQLRECLAREDRGEEHETAWSEAIETANDLDVGESLECDEQMWKIVGGDWPEWTVGFCDCCNDCEPSGGWEGDDHAWGNADMRDVRNYIYDEFWRRDTMPNGDYSDWCDAHDITDYLGADGEPSMDEVASAYMCDYFDRHAELIDEIRAEAAMRFGIPGIVDGDDDIVSIIQSDDGEIEIEVWANPSNPLGATHVMCEARDDVAALLGCELRHIGSGEGDGTKIGIFEVVDEEMMMTQSLHDRVVEFCENAACSVAQNDWDALAYYRAAAAQAAEFLGQRVRLDSGTELAGVLGDMALDALTDENAKRE